MNDEETIEKAASWLVAGLEGQIDLACALQPKVDKVALWRAVMLRVTARVPR